MERQNLKLKLARLLRTYRRLAIHLFSRVFWTLSSPLWRRDHGFTSPDQARALRVPCSSGCEQARVQTPVRAHTRVPPP